MSPSQSSPQPHTDGPAMSDILAIQHNCCNTSKWYLTLAIKREEFFVYFKYSGEISGSLLCRVSGISPDSRQENHKLS